MRRPSTGRARREDSAETGSSSTEARCGDGLDNEVWRRLGAIIRAADIGDADEFAGLWQSLERELTDHQRGLAGVYVFYIVEYRVHDILQRRPGPADLHDLAVRASTRFERIIRPTEASLYDTLCTVFKFAPADRQVTGGRLLVVGSAAFAALTDGPSSELQAIRLPLARWYAAHAQKFRELGSMAPPRAAP
jgi:hypothetical protein